MAGDRPVPGVPPDVLSPTELRVAKLFTVGCSVREIANRISSSPEAVEALCDGIYEKLGVHDRETLQRWATHFDIGRW